MKKRKILFIASLIFSLYISCQTNKFTAIKSSLDYDNYYDKSVGICVNLTNLKLDIINLEKNKKIEIDMPISNPIVIKKEDELYNIICEQDLINHWYYRKNNTDNKLFTDSVNIREKARQAIIESHKAFTNKILLLGKVQISDNYNSFLIQTEINTRLVKNLIGRTNEFILKESFLINIKDQKILSMVKLASYFVIENAIITHTIILNKNKFLMINDSINNEGINFQINSKGKIVF